MEHLEAILDKYTLVRLHTENGKQLIDIIAYSYKSGSSITGNPNDVWRIEEYDGMQGCSIDEIVEYGGLDGFVTNSAIIYTTDCDFDYVMNYFEKYLSCPLLTDDAVIDAPDGYYYVRNNFLEVWQAI